MTSERDQSNVERSIALGWAYTEEGEPIGIRPHEDGEHVVLTIHDREHLLNLGHCEQLDRALFRAVVFLAVRGRANG